MIFDVAEALGQPVERLRHEVTEAELLAWNGGRGPLWPRRLEVLLAQIAYVIHASNGGKMTFRDFDLYSRVPKASPVEVLASDDAIVVKRVFKKAKAAARNAPRVIKKGARNG